MAREDPDERAFRCDLVGARFQRGVDRADWRLEREDWTWPNPIIAVAAAQRPASPDELALRFTLDGYPVAAPTAAPWHLGRDGPLPRELWPTGGRVSLAFNPDWRMDAVYIPCDRLAIAGHDPWLEQHRAYLWGPGKDIVHYLRLIHDLLHSPAYSGARRPA